MAGLIGKRSGTKGVFEGRNGSAQNVPSRGGGYMVGELS